MTIPPRIHRALVWAARVIVGAVFIFSGFTKLVDPWGGMYKIQEYLAAWDISFVPRSLVFIAAFLLGSLEFVCGVCLALGLMRRLVPRVLIALMAFLLPLSLYIAIANPVSDCGCFGDALQVSNLATFLKNVVLVAVIIYLLRHNVEAPHPFHPLMQWLVVCASIAYCLVVSGLGYTVQPLVDFRPYPVGEPLLSDDSADVRLIYEKGGEQRLFSVDSLPGDDWAYVSTVHYASPSNVKQIAIFDGEDDVTDAVLTESDPLLILFVADLPRHGLARGAMANKLARAMRQRGGDMIAVVAAPDADAAQRWAERVNAEYEVFTADDTQIKEVARGDAALAYLSADTLRWKANLYSFPGDFPKPGQDLGNVRAVEQSMALPVATGVYLLSLLLIFSARFVIRNRRNCDTKA